MSQSGQKGNDALSHTEKKLQESPLGPHSEKLEPRPCGTTLCMEGSQDVVLRYCSNTILTAHMISKGTPFLSLFDHAEPTHCAHASIRGWCPVLAFANSHSCTRGELWSKPNQKRPDPESASAPIKPCSRRQYLPTRRCLTFRGAAEIHPGLLEKENTLVHA